MPSKKSTPEPEPEDTITVRLDRDLVAQLRVLAAQRTHATKRRASVGALIQEAVLAHLGQQLKRRG